MTNNTNLVVVSDRTCAYVTDEYGVIVSKGSDVRNAVSAARSRLVSKFKRLERNERFGTNGQRLLKTA